MAAPSTVASGVPIKLLHEAESHIVTVELKSGDAYRGIMLEAEDTMNCQLKEGKDAITSLSSDNIQLPNLIIHSH